MRLGGPGTWTALQSLPPILLSSGIQTGLQPGQYIIDAEATYNSHPCTGSMRVTVTY